MKAEFSFFNSSFFILDCLLYVFENENLGWNLQLFHIKNPNIKICSMIIQVADSWESLEGWLDAIRLVYTIYARGKSEVLAAIVTS